MIRHDSKKQTFAFALLGLIPVIWLGLLIAPAIAGGLPEIMQSFPTAINNPLDIAWCEDSLKTVLIFVAAYGISIGIYLSNKKNYCRREEHGSAKWGNAAAISRRYKGKVFANDKILTRNMRMGFHVHKHRRNLNVLICGGSGSGKTRSYAKPNAMQCNSSMVILDPKGEILRDTGHLLVEQGMKLKVLDLINMSKSHCYNPFIYLQTDNDVQRLVTNLFKATTPKGTQTQDPFWDFTSSMLLSALIFYLRYEAPENEQNFAMVMEMLRAAEVREDDDDYRSPLDDLFDILESEEPNHIAVKYYKLYRKGSGKTLKSIQITLAAKLEKFNLVEMEKLTATDELDITKMGTEKTALFIITPDSDTSFNFLVSVLYTQLFQTLFYQADYVHHGSLPVHVHFIMDEFANVSLPDDFEKSLSTMRSRGVSVSIILQNIAQLKALFEKQWESILGNCDEFLYLGGNETSTHELVSKMLGKQTLDTNTFGKSTGRNGNYSTNYQNAGRELLMPDEVRMLDNRYAILFIRGELAVLDDKYDILRHPNVGATTDGRGAPYDHGAEETSSGAIQLMWRDAQSRATPTAIQESAYALYSETDLEEIYHSKEKQPHEKQQSSVRPTSFRKKSRPTDEPPVYPKRRS